ncbi:MAG: ABC transporter permease subunit [Pararhizobium sp.]
MLVWSRSGTAFAQGIAGLLILVVYIVPLAIIVAASFAGQWNGVWPSHFGLSNFANALHGQPGAALRASIITGVVASAVALVSGTCAALALRDLKGPSRRVLDVLFFMPSAVPSVSVGLGLLVAFSQPPVLLNGTTAIVVIAHLVLVSAFTYGAVTAGLMQLPRDVEQMAESLGARPAYRLRRVTLPLLVPYLAAAFSLSFALSMGELGATAMVYPPGWMTMPVSIFALTDRGDIFEGAALTVILIAATLILLGIVQAGMRRLSR